MAQWLTGLVAVPVDLGFISIFHMAAHNHQ